MRLLVAVLFAALALGPTGLSAQGSADTDRSVLPPDPAEGLPIVGDPEEPRGHFRVVDPPELGAAEARAAYADLKDRMAAAYAVSGEPAARRYQEWRRYNDRPYLSSTHGNRYVNNYANAAAAGYGRWEDIGALPEGAVVAKDSFTVTRGGLVTPGALFVMEKMASGFNPVSGDWRYTMILPDGTLFGTTHGRGSRRVQYCISCHLAAEDTDHLHLVPEEYRAAPGS